MNSRSDPECDYVYKIVLSGEMGVGKSNILQRYHKGIFTRISPTIGVEFLTKKIILKSGDIVKAQIWDTSGSERYRSITTGHYRSAVGALLVFDLTDRESFEQLSYWLNCLREHADEHLVIALVANKYDLTMDDQNQRQVSKIEIMKFADENDLIFIGESSALSDLNIKEVVETLMEKIHETQLKVNETKVQKSMKLKQKYTRNDNVNNGSYCCSN